MYINQGYLVSGKSLNFIWPFQSSFWEGVTESEQEVCCKGWGIQHGIRGSGEGTEYTQTQV